jgi:hypothetical protein
MTLFVAQFASTGGDDLATLAADIGIEADGDTLDPAAWHDWIERVRSVKGDPPVGDTWRTMGAPVVERWRDRDPGAWSPKDDLGEEQRVTIDPSRVASRTELAAFLDDLAGRVTDAPENIPNADVAAFLHSASGWVSDMDGYFENRGESIPVEPTWGLVASIFAAALVYE